MNKKNKYIVLNSIKKLSLLTIFLLVIILVFPVYNTFENFVKYNRSGLIDLYERASGPPRSSLHLVGWELIKPLQKFFFQAFNKDFSVVGLPQVHLFIPEKSLSNLQVDLPYSSKVWQPGYLTYPDNSIKEIKIKNRGDNVRNYVFDKKSWRIKTKKNSLLNGYRNWHYVVPRDKSFLTEVISSKVSNHLGLLNAERRLVELFINSESAGILVESKRYDETWLRKQNLMPVNIYKLETNINKVQKILQTSNSIQNPSHWNDKRAFNNRTIKKDYLLENTLDNINKSVNYRNYSANHINFQFPETIQIKEIIRKIISLEGHASTLSFEKSSLFMISDDQSGHVTILPQDPRSEYESIDLNNGTKINNVIKRLMLDCNQIQLCLSIEDSKFRYRTLSYLYQSIIYDDILNKLSDELLKIRDSLKISLKRDFARIDLLTNLKEKIDLTFKPTTNLQNFDKVISNINIYNKQLTFMLKSNPIINWSSIENNLKLFINGLVPAKNFEIFLNHNFKHYDSLKVFFDTNANLKIDNMDKELPISFKDNKIIIDATILSEFKNNFSGKLNDQADFIWTEFNFLFSHTLSINKVFAQNPFSKVNFEISNKLIQESRLPSRFNIPIVKEKKSEVKIIEGIWIVDENKTFDEPVIIKEGTKIFIKKNKILVFRNKLVVNGSTQEPVVVDAYDENPFGSFVLQGIKTNGSQINNFKISNGSGGRLNGINYLGMFSIHNANNIIIRNIELNKNKIYDDSLHIVYSNSIDIDGIKINNANMDAIDIDISDVKIKNGHIYNAGNDCFDSMQSNVILKNIIVKKCGDKGLSIGENSIIKVTDAKISNNSIGIEIKDESIIKIEDIDFINNDIQISSFNKNWHYGNKDASISIDKSVFRSKNGINVIKATKKRKVKIFNSSVIGKFSNTENLELDNLSFEEAEENRKPFTKPIIDKIY